MSKGKGAGVHERQKDSRYLRSVFPSGKREFGTITIPLSLAEFRARRYSGEILLYIRLPGGRLVRLQDATSEQIVDFVKTASAADLKEEDLTELQDFCYAELQERFK